MLTYLRHTSFEPRRLDPDGAEMSLSGLFTHV